MYHRMMVLEVKDAYCLALTDDGAVMRIRLKNGIKVGDRIYVLAEDMFQPAEKRAESPSKVVSIEKGLRRHFPMRRIAAAAAAVLLVFALLLHERPGNQVYAAVSIDGAKSIQMKLNDEFVVLDAVSYDGTVSEEEIRSVIGCGLTQAEEKLEIKTADKKEGLLVGYGVLKDDDASANQELKRQVETQLEGTRAVYLQGDADDLKEAEREQETLGLYVAKKAVKEDRLEDYLSEMTLEEMLDVLRKQPALMEQEETREILEEKWEAASPKDTENDSDSKKTQTPVTKKDNTQTPSAAAKAKADKEAKEKARKAAEEAAERKAEEAEDRAEQAEEQREEAEDREDDAVSSTDIMSGTDSEDDYDEHDDYDDSEAYEEPEETDDGGDYEEPEDDSEDDEED